MGHPRAAILAARARQSAIRAIVIEQRGGDVNDSLRRIGAVEMVSHGSPGGLTPAEAARIALGAMKSDDHQPGLQAAMAEKRAQLKRDAASAVCRMDRKHQRIAMQQGPRITLMLEELQLRTSSPARAIWSGAPRS